MSKTPVVLDTMVLLRMLTDETPYVNVLERIKEKCNKILFSTPILKEWRTKAYTNGMSALILITKLEELRQIKKLKRCKQTSIKKAQRLISRERCRKTTDKYDLKFVEAGLAGKAIIITKDSTLLDLNPYTCGKVCLKITTPENYLADS